MSKVKMSNVQLNAFTSPQLRELLGDKHRMFPVQTAFAIHENLDVIRRKLKAYNETLQGIFKKHGVTVEPNGAMIYPKKDGVQQEVQQALKELSEMTIEVDLTLIKMGDDWPKLTVTEIAILRPMIDG